jgi:hypothetical protein
MSDETTPTTTPPLTAALLPDWTKGKTVCSIAEAVDESVVLETQMDSAIPSLEFSWFAVKASAGNSTVEEQEKLVAIKEQIALGIINPDGSPTSSKKKDKTPPVKQPGGKLARKALRMREKAIVKDMAKQQKKMNKMVLLKNNQTDNQPSTNSPTLNGINITERK